MLVVIPLEEISNRKLSVDTNKKQIEAATMCIFAPTVLRVFYLLSLRVVNLVHPEGSLALPKYMPGVFPSLLYNRGMPYIKGCHGFSSAVAFNLEAKDSGGTI